MRPRPATRSRSTSADSGKEKGGPHRAALFVCQPKAAYSAKKPGYSGTAIYTKKKPDRIETLGIPEFDDEGRTTIAYFGNLAVISAYFPNSQGEGARLPYKLSFCDAVFKKCSSLVADGFNIVLGGDYNIAHKPIDLANPKANEKNAGYLPEERADGFFHRERIHGHFQDVQPGAKPVQLVELQDARKGKERGMAHRLPVRERRIQGSRQVGGNLAGRDGKRPLPSVSGYRIELAITNSLPQQTKKSCKP